MTPERYRQIGELYHAALELDEQERAAFLERVCAGDEEMRREIESLVSSHERADDFIAEPALAVAAGLFADREAAVLAEGTVSHYKILSLIGAGGMGQVYLAQDTGLGRRVALKLLPEHFTSDHERINRFRQEARAASALNHPNIITIHEIGMAGERHYITTEYIEGETLRERLTRGAFGVREALDVAAQVADALVAAHQAGIVHRDVKPENVMLRADGYVKVLDFGLAKLTENLAALGPSGADALTIPDVRTNPGVVMGTPDYMSPEQARGLPVDARADVWSLGVVLYEMVVGRRPFEGATHSDTIVSILEREPSSLLSTAPEAPAELERIVTKALAKNAEERYQTARDMATDLRNLRRRLEIEAELKISGQLPGKVDASVAKPSNGLRPVETNTQAATAVSAAGAARTTSSLEYVVGEITRHKRAAVLVAVALVLFLGSAGYGLYRLVNQPARSALLPFQTTKMLKLTATGKVKDAAISRDGKYMVYAEEADRQQSLWVKQVATGRSVQIVPPADVGYFGLTFSNDGNYIYFVKAVKGDFLWVLYQVPSLGGAPRKMIERVDSAITFSPDGRRIAFLRGDPEKGESALITVNADGTGEQRLALRKSPDFFYFEGIVRPAWSPDGKFIACPAGSVDAEGQYQYVVVVSVEGGAMELLASKRWERLSQVSWLSDGSGLMMAAGDEDSPAQQLWRLSYPAGDAQRITNDLNQYSDVSLTGDGKNILTVQTNRSSNIWLAPDGDPVRAKQITSGTSDNSLGLSWTPEGKIIYQSDASGKPQLWSMNVDGGDQKQLTHDGSNYRPAVSPDGRYIVFHSSRSGQANIWRMDSDGDNLKQLTNGKTNLFPDVSPDGQWVVYASMNSGKMTLWKVSIDGGEPVQLTQAITNLPTISPDGKQVASFYWPESVNDSHGVVILPFGGGQFTKRFNIPADAINGFVLRWSPDGRAILHLREDLLNIWSQPVDGGKPSQLTSFQGDQIFNFAWSHDGKSLALARGRVAEDVVMISDLR